MEIGFLCCKTEISSNFTDYIEKEVSHVHQLSMDQRAENSPTDGLMTPGLYDESMTGF